MTPFHLHDPRLLKAAGICFLLAAFFFSVMVLSGCASSRLGKVLNVGIGISATADLITTEQALQRGAAEANPIMRSDLRWLVKGLGVGTVIGVASILDSKDQAVWAHVIRLVAIAVNVGAGIHNAGVSR